MSLGNLMFLAARHDAAMAHYQKALELEADCAVAMLNLGAALQDQERVTEARDWFGRAANRSPEKVLWRLREATLCPAVFRSNEEIDAWREETAATLDRYRGAVPKMPWNEIMYAGVFPTFNLSYQGRNNRRLKEGFAALYEKSFQDLPEPEGSGLKDRKRIGVVVTQRHEGIFLRCMTGVLKRLDPPHFGAGSSAYDVFTYHHPLVTLPGELNVGRVGYAFYTKMGVPDLVASTPEHYVELAVRVGRDREFRASVREKIAAAAGALFEDLDTVRAHEQFFEEALRADAV